MNIEHYDDGLAGQWRLDAACLEHVPELWFPDHGESASDARTICRGCPVKTECLEYAIASPDLLQGIWGGTTERQRRRLRQAYHHNGERRTETTLRRMDQIRTLVAKGSTTAQMAMAIGVSVRTVRRLVKELAA